jgi:hypothetical protein
MSLPGPKPTSRDVRLMSEMGGKADIELPPIIFHYRNQFSLTASPGKPAVGGVGVPPADRYDGGTAAVRPAPLKWDQNPKKPAPVNRSLPSSTDLIRGHYPARPSTSASISSATCSNGTGQSTSALPSISDINLFCDRQCIVYIDAEVSHCAFNLSVT